MALIGSHVRADEKAGRADHVAGTELFTVRPYQPVIHAHGEIKLGRRQDVSQNRARRRSADLTNFSFQSCICRVATSNSKSAVLLKLFDDGIGHEHFHARDKRFVRKRRDRDRVDVAKIIRLGRSDVVAQATAQTEAG